TAKKLPAPSLSCIMQLFLVFMSFHLPTVVFTTTFLHERLEHCRTVAIISATFLSNSALKPTSLPFYLHTLGWPRAGPGRKKSRPGPARPVSARLEKN